MHLLFLIPKNILSRWVGGLVHLQLPLKLRVVVIELFAKKYRINLNDAEKPLAEYISIGDFFTRALKSGIRPVGQSPYVHPTDSLISEAGEINDGLLIQAKGLKYTAEEFLGSVTDASVFKSGGAFVTYYLCPTDYHRVHSPIKGQIWRIRHIPGTLWPVNRWSVGRIKNLFAKNERVVVNLQTNRGAQIALVMVGATNVGMISMDAVWKGLRTNLVGVSEPREQSFPKTISIEKSAELGIFHMGSTVIMLFSQEALRELGLSPKSLQALKNRQVQMGQAT